MDQSVVVPLFVVIHRKLRGSSTVYYFSLAGSRQAHSRAGWHLAGRKRSGGGWANEKRGTSFLQPKATKPRQLTRWLCASHVLRFSLSIYFQVHKYHFPLPFCRINSIMLYRRYFSTRNRPRKSLGSKSMEFEINHRGRFSWKIGAFEVVSITRLWGGERASSWSSSSVAMATRNHFLRKLKIT